MLVSRFNETGELLISTLLLAVNAELRRLESGAVRGRAVDTDDLRDEADKERFL